MALSKKLRANQRPAVPLYLNRAAFIPRKPEDFGDGGAFPEVHVAQYPLDLGRDPKGKIHLQTLPVTVDLRGNNIGYDAVVKQNENQNRIVYSRHQHVIPKILKNNAEGVSEIDPPEIEETTQETKAALEKIVSVRLGAVPSDPQQFIKYKPSLHSTAYNSGAEERLIRMVQKPVDPLEPPKFRFKRVPKACSSSPVPVMRSPPRPVTLKDLQDWNIPPCISNWKNPKGYSIPLDKRLAADGRGLQEAQINDNFSKLPEALYVAEQKAREDVALRSKLQKEISMKDNEKKEQELKALAQRARAERTSVVAPPPAAENVVKDNGNAREEAVSEPVKDDDEKLQRDKIREERRCERVRDRRLEAMHPPPGKRSKTTRDRERDVSEKVALGMASGKTAGKGGEVVYDQRLFNQDKGMGSGFDSDDQYNLYDIGLFASRCAMSTLYNPKSSKDPDTYVDADADKELDTIKKTSMFMPDREFSGASERAAGPRSGPIEFEKDVEEVDPFGLELLLTKMKKGKN